MGRLLYSFHPRSLPLMARLSYQRELLSWTLLPLMLSGLQGGTIAVFVKKAFEGVEGVSPQQLNLAVGVIAASKAIGHLSSFLWASASHGRPKIRFIMWLQIITALFIGLIAFVPRTAVGLWSVAVLCIITWMIWCGVMTLRAGVWRANYQVSYRPTIAGKLSTVHALIVAGAGVAIGYCLDLNPMSYKIVFPVLAVCGVFGAWSYGRVPFRRKTQQLRAEKTSNHARGRAFHPSVIWHVVAHDRPYREYMICMFVMGIGNLMIHPILALVLTEKFNVGYQTGITIATVIPLVCMTLAIPFWTRKLESMHVTQFRAIHVWTFVSASALMTLGVATSQIAFLYLGAVATGVGWGGGVLAWNLGHQHFAPAARDTEYMGVHITLTGVRGFIGPIIAVLLYNWLVPYDWHVGVFLICLLMNVIGAVGFVIIARKMRHRNRIARELVVTASEAPLERELVATGAGN